MSTLENYQRADIRIANITFAIVLIAAAALYFETFVSIVDTWGFDGYSHGYIVLPICIYLVWRERQRLTGTPTSRSYIGVVALLVLSALWWVGDNLGIQVVRQFAVVSMVPMVVLAVFGPSIAKSIRFALAYLLFAVPFGEFLIPYLIDFTASFSVDVLNVFGIPVLQDGQYFHVPSGSYEVAKACAGLSYFISTLALSVLYAHLLFSSARKAAFFVTFAVVLSVVTNGIRATTIVLLLHYTDLDIAAGEDHEFIGWILYGLMIILIIWIGQRYADPAGGNDSPGELPSDSIPGSRTQEKFLPLSVGILAVIAVSTGPVLNFISGGLTRSDEMLTAGLPTNVVGWTGAAMTEPVWRPNYVGYSQMSLGRYLRGRDQVEVALVRYLGQKQGAEITNAANSVADLDEWDLGDVVTSGVDVNSFESILVSEVIASRAGESRLIWYWNEIGGIQTSGVLKTKFTEIRDLLTGKPSISSAFILAAPINGSVPDSQHVLRDFLIEFYMRSRTCVITDPDRTQCALDAPGGKET